METTMRWLTAALILLLGIGTASADIRIDESRYVDGKLIITGQTAPGRAVTLDKKFKTKSNADGNFKFTINKYKPADCMSDIRSGTDVYSAVIAGCFGVISGPGAVTTSGKPAKHM
jgi:hypothetical protein